MTQPFENEVEDRDTVQLGIASELTKALFPPRNSQAYQAVAGVREALDEVQTQLKRDFLHRQASRSASKRNPAVSISGSNPSSPRSRPVSPTIEPRQPTQFEPHLDPVLDSTFFDYYQSRKANGGGNLSQGKTYVAASLSLFQAKANLAAVTGLGLQGRGTSPSGLKQVLSQLHPIKPPIVVLHNRSSSAERLPSMHRSQYVTRGYEFWAGRGSYSNNRPQRNPAQPAGWTPACFSSPASREDDLCKHTNIRLQSCSPNQQDGRSSKDNIQLMVPSAVQTLERPWSGCRSPVQLGSPQNHLVLRTLALHTPHNIVSPGCMQSSVCTTGNTVCVTSPDRRSSQGIHANITAAPHNMQTSPDRLMSPWNIDCVSCSACSQKHALQHHRSCCHCCSSCCQCHTGQRHELQPAAENSNTSSDACSCPCIKAYKKGQRDANKVARSAGALTLHQGPLTSHAAAPVVMQLPATTAISGQQDSVKDFQAAANAAYCTADSTDHASYSSDVMDEGIAANRPGGADSGADHLTVLLQQMNDMQEQLLQQGPPFDAQVLEEMSGQLAQMVAWSEPQHEELLRQALAKQQELLTLQQRELLASNPGASTSPPVLQRAQQVQQQEQQHAQYQLGGQQAGTAGSMGDERTGSWVAEQHQRALQGDLLSARGGQATQLPQAYSQASQSSTLAAVSRLLGNFDEAAALSGTNSSARRLTGSASAAMHGSVRPTIVGIRDSPTIHVQALTSPRQPGKVSWMDNPLAKDHEQQLGLLDLQDDGSDYLAIDSTFETESPSKSTQERRTLQQPGMPTGADLKQQRAFPEVLTKEDSEAILAAVQAAYDDAFAGVAAQPMLHFMMAPNYAAGGDDGGWGNGGAVLRQGPPQVTAIAQVVDPHAESTAFGPGIAADSRGIRASGQQKGSRFSADVQQQHFSRPVASAAGVAGSMVQQPTVECLEYTLNPGVGQTNAHIWSQHPECATSHEQDYLQQQLSRLSSMKGPSSQAGSGITNPRASRLAYSATGGTSIINSNMHQGTPSALTSVSDSGRSCLAGAARSADGSRGGTTHMVQAVQDTPAMSHSGSRSSSKQSRITGTDLHATSQGQTLAHAEASPRSANSSTTRTHAAVQQMHQQLSVFQGQRQGDGVGLTYALGQQQSQPIKQQQQDLALRAGSFETPDSTISSLEHSAQPSATHLPVSMSAAQVATGKQVVDPSVGAQASDHPVHMTGMSTNDTPSAQSQAAKSMSTTRSCYAATATASAQACGPLIANMVGSPASIVSLPMGACMPRFTCSKPQGLELDSLMSPITSMPASARSSTLTSEPEQVAQQHSRTPLQHESSCKSSCKTPKEVQAQMQQLSRRMSSMRSTVTPPGGTTPRVSSEWKQRQLLMQQQLLAQQQQLLQIQSVSNSAASTPRQSAVTRSAAANRRSTATVLSPSARPSTTVEAAPGGLQTLVSSEDQTAAVPSLQQLIAADRARGMGTERCSQRLGTTGCHMGQAKPPDFSSDVPDGSEHKANPAQSTALLQLLLNRRKRMLVQKVLGGWRRYTAVHRVMGAIGSDNSSASSAEEDAAEAGNSRADRQNVVSIALGDMNAGLQQCISTAAAAAVEDGELEFVISGEVRVQRSPTRQRPASAAAGCTALNSRCRKGTPLPGVRNTPVDDSAIVQSRSLQNAMMEVKSMVEKMEKLCVSSDHTQHQQGCRSGNSASNTVVGRPAANCRPGGQSTVLSNRQQVSGNSPTSKKSPDRYKLRGQLRHVQDKLAKIEVKMCQAQAMSDDWCCSGATGCDTSPQRRAANLMKAERVRSCLQQQQLVCGCGAGCRGGCVRRAGVKRQILVGRMQDEIGQLQHELAELRQNLPGAYA